MSGLPQRIQCRARPLFLNQYIVRVMRRDGKDGHAVVRERFDKRQQHSGEREFEWSLELETNPAVKGVYAGWKILRRANNRKFLAGASARGKFASRGPLRQGRIRGEAHDRIRAIQQASKFQLMSHS